MIKTNDREFKFQAQNELECTSWVEVIKEHIYKSQGFKNRLPAPTTKFWKEFIISEQQFIERADTFDIVLFQTISLDGRRIRDYTKCDFDHVAMVLKYAQQPGEVFILEVVPGEGI